MECDSDLPSTQLYEMLSLTHMPWGAVLLVCDFVSDQPVVQLLAMVRQLQPVMY